MARQALNITLTRKQAGILYTGLLLLSGDDLDVDSEVLSTYLASWLGMANDLHSVHVDQLTITEG